MMMMGAGLLFMLMIALVVIGLPVLIIVLIAGGGLSAFLNSVFASSSPVSPSIPPASRASSSSQRCPTCGREVQPEWKVCPTCGTTLT